MLLSTHERLRFAQYCRLQSETCRGLAKQFEEKMAHGMADELSRREKQKAAAYEIVALDLSAHREEFTVGREDVGEGAR